MTFQNIQSGRVIRAVASAFGLAVLLSLAAQMVVIPFLPDDMRDRMIQMSMNQAYDEVNDITSDYGTEYALLLTVQWAMALLSTLWMGRWAAKQAISPEQAVGYGTAVGLGVMFSYGVVCIGFSLVNPLLRLGFFLLLPLAGVLGGRWAGANLDKFRRQRSQPYGFPQQPVTPWSSPGLGQPSLGQPTVGMGPDVYYNMGVTAAMGARRDEARAHFSRVLQMNPYYLPAWLQLANLADTPEQAWNYVQQARAINANDPAVVQAVNLIWPQVAANAARSQQTRGGSLLREIEGQTEPVIQPPPVIVPPAQQTLPDAPPAVPTVASDLPTEQDQLPVVPDLPADIPPDESEDITDTPSDKKEKHPDTFDPWG